MRKNGILRASTKRKSVDLWIPRYVHTSFVVMTGEIIGASSFLGRFGLRIILALSILGQTRCRHRLSRFSHPERERENQLFELFLGPAMGEGHGLFKRRLGFF
jgi:hypothetical protein